MERWIRKALEAGFDEAAELDCAHLVARPEVRAACSTNSCRRYGTSWSCPPGCGTLEECAARLRGYSKGLIVQTVGQLEDEFDGEGMMEAAERHARTFRRLAAELRREFPRMLPMGTGSCSRCDSCTYPDAPCRDPFGASPPMEAYGILVADACRASGIPYYHGKGTITYTACFLLQ